VRHLSRSLGMMAALWGLCGLAVLLAVSDPLPVAVGMCAGFIAGSCATAAWLLDRALR
jgi:hypothetical protein